MTEISMDQEGYVKKIKEAEFHRDLKDDVLPEKERHRTYRGIVVSLL